MSLTLGQIPPTMNVAFANGTMTLTKSNGDLAVINLEDITGIEILRRAAQTRANVGTGPSVPQVYDPSTNTFSNQVVTTTYNFVAQLSLTDNRMEQLEMGKQSGSGSTWTNDQTGANAAVTAIRNAMPNS
jgi:hypothetical protein